MSSRIPSAPSRPAPSAHVAHNDSGASVRRNLFSSNFSRRPNTASSDDTVALSPSHPPLQHFSTGPPKFESSGPTVASSRSASGNSAGGPPDEGIVIRDEFGNTGAEMQLPSPDEDEDENMGAAGVGEHGEHGSIRVDTRLIEMWRGQNRNLVDPVELKAVVQASLREKVAAMEDDKWMFEAEEDVEGQY